jgi:hypothetical protein
MTTIPEKVVLAPLSTKDQSEFLALSTDHEKINATILGFSRESRVARKRELKAQLKVAPADKALSIAAEIESLEGSFKQAKSATKQQLRALGKRYGALFPRLFDRCNEDLDKLIENADAQWKLHLESFETSTTDTSPAVRALQAWKQTLKQRRTQLDQMIAHGMAPNAPRSYLGYPDKL